MTTIPFVFLVPAVKVLLSNGLHFEGLIDFSDVALVLTGGVFLIGFMLAGTIADYKESEKIPGELASNLEYLEEAGAHMCAVNQYGGKVSIQDDRESIDPYVPPPTSTLGGGCDKGTTPPPPFPPVWPAPTPGSWRGRSRCRPR